MMSFPLSKEPRQKDNVRSLPIGKGDEVQGRRQTRRGAGSCRMHRSSGGKACQVVAKEVVCTSKKFRIEPMKLLSWGSMRSIYFRKMIVRGSVKGVQGMERGWGKRNQAGGFCNSLLQIW